MVLTRIQIQLFMVPIQIHNTWVKSSNSWLLELLQLLAYTVEDSIQLKMSIRSSVTACLWFGCPPVELGIVVVLFDPAFLLQISNAMVHGHLYIRQTLIITISLITGLVSTRTRGNLSMPQGHYNSWLQILYLKPWCSKARGFKRELTQTLLLSALFGEGLK